MDINLARTFLEVVATGSFVTAGQRLHITQSTVSARIRLLEDTLGQALFERGKTGATMTPAGEQFQRYAAALVRVWQQAKHDLSLPPGCRSVITIGGEVSLWDQLLLDWLAWMTTRVTDVAIRAERGSSELLTDHLVAGTLDIGVMYTPQQRPGLTVEKLFESELILVGGGVSDGMITPENYVYIDWGPEFRAYHTATHDRLTNARLYVDSCSVGFQYILANGGAGYVPERIAQPHLDDGTLSRLSADARFTLPVYLVYATDGDKMGVQEALQGLAHLAGK